VTGLTHFAMAHEKKAELVNSITAANPTTFDQLFLFILFSKEYLMKAERPKNFEEAFFNIAGRIQWVPYDHFFQDLAYPYPSGFPTLKNMGQAPLTYKLGRFPEVPLDSLSFSYYHKAVRERLLIDLKTDASNTADGGWQKDFINVLLQGDDFIHYLFLSVLSRKATAQELQVLNDAIVKRKYQTNREGQAMIVLDYLSRLAELYTFVAVQ